MTTEVGAAHAIASFNMTMLVECRSAKCGYPGTPLLVSTGTVIMCNLCRTRYHIVASPHPVNPAYIQFLVVATPPEGQSVIDGN